MQQRRGRPPADPHEQELARLQRENARLREQLAKQARVLEVQGELSRAFKARDQRRRGRPQRADRPDQPGGQLSAAVEVAITQLAPM